MERDTKKHGGRWREIKETRKEMERNTKKLWEENEDSYQEPREKDIYVYAE